MNEDGSPEEEVLKKMRERDIVKDVILIYLNYFEKTGCIKGMVIFF